MPITGQPEAALLKLTGRDHHSLLESAILDQGLAHGMGHLASANVPYLPLATGGPLQHMVNSALPN